MNTVADTETATPIAPRRPGIRARPALAAVAAVTVLPAGLMALGVDFGTTSAGGAARGEFVHTLLEWSALATALFTGLLAFAHYDMRREPATAVFALALVAAGAMDGFHALAANGLIESAADDDRLIPFTWALCRFFNAAILLIGVSVVLLGDHHRGGSRSDVPLVLVTAVFVLLAFVVIDYAATHDDLPRTMYEDDLVKRPWDIAPLLLYVATGALLLPVLHRRGPSAFTHSLALSMIPHCAVQLHMAFGSETLFDGHFNVAHGLKIFAYVVPMLGLLDDYRHVYRRQAAVLVRLRESRALAESAVEEMQRRADESESARATAEAVGRVLREKQEALERAGRRLAQSNEALEQFAYIASHDLKTPLRGVDTMVEWLCEDLGEAAHAPAIRGHLARLRDRVRQMEHQLEDLLAFSRVGRRGILAETVDLTRMVTDIADDIGRGGEHEIVAGANLPVLETGRAPLETILRSLMVNAVVHHDRRRGRIEVHAHVDGGRLHLAIVDDGPGIPGEHHERIFRMYQRVGDGGAQGGGVGLAIVKRLVESTGGTVRVSSSAATRGATFEFDWPLDWSEA